MGKAWDPSKNFHGDGTILARRDPIDVLGTSAFQASLIDTNDGRTRIMVQRALAPGW